VTLTYLFTKKESITSLGKLRSIAKAASFSLRNLSALAFDSSTFSSN
jgi:hypothetical protein